MTASSSYTPPTSAEIGARQNSPDGLRLLIAQRRLYRKAKRWLSLRWLGMVIIGLGAPVVSVLWPSLAVVAGGIAGLWLFLGRTVLELFQASSTAKAAAVQEQFDFFVFGMPRDTSRSSMPSPEELAALVGPEEQVAAVSRREKLVDWYPVDISNKGRVAVAICQRANASYTDRLLRSTVTVWIAATTLWLLALVVASVAKGLPLSAFLLGVIFPILPAFLDAVQQVTSIRSSASDRGDLARTIESRLDGSAGALQADELLSWQTQMYDLRRTLPVIPDLLYWTKRKANEPAMKTAARQLGRKARDSGQ